MFLSINPKLLDLQLLKHFKTIIKKEFTVTHRILHWSLGLLMTVLFITGFLRMQWMGRKPIVAVIEQDAPGVMTKEQTMAIVNDILNPMGSSKISGG